MVDLVPVSGSTPPEIPGGIREEFPVRGRWAYLNHAAIAPLPRRAAARLAAVARTISQGGSEGWEERVSQVEGVRELARRLLGARAAHEVAFVANTAVGLSLVAEGLPWRAGDNVVGARCEFPSNVYPWMGLEDRGVEYRLAPERHGRVETEELLALVDDRTRVVALSWVQFASGFRADLERIGRFCRERGVLFVVDVIQGLGALRLEVEASLVDVAAGATHKWLLGPEGLGLLYVSDRVLDRIRPVQRGWRSVREPFRWSEFELAWAEGAKRFEPGTANVLGILALGASLELLLEVGPEAIEARVLALARRTAQGLRESGFEIIGPAGPGEDSGIVAAVHPHRDGRELETRLRRAGIVVAHRQGRLRISPHFYNQEAEIDRLVEVAAR